MSEIKFPEGISVFARNTNAPDFVGESILIDTPKLIAWLQSQQLKVRLQIMTAKSGKKYLKVDDFVPKENTPPPPQKVGPATDELGGDLPF